MIDLIKDLPDEQIQLSPNLAKNLENGFDFGWLELLGLIPKYEENIAKPSPFEPQDPMDCRNWPQSPFCGGGWNPFDLLGFDYEIVYNECEVCLRTTPKFLGFSGPPIVVCKRLDDCAPPPPPPPPPPPSGEELPPAPPIEQNPCPASFSEGSDWVLVDVEITGTTFYFWLVETGCCDGDNSRRWWLDGDYSGMGDKVSEPYVRRSNQETNFRRKVWLKHPLSLNITTDTTGSSSSRSIYRRRVWSVCASGTATYRETNPNTRFNSISYSNPQKISLFSATIYSAGTQEWDEARIDDPEQFCATWSAEHDDIRIKELGDFTVSIGSETSPPPPPPSSPPPPPPLPPPPPPCNCMNCCCSNNSQNSEDNDDLLRYIAYKLGTEELPAQLPASMIGNGAETVEIPSIVSLVGWKIRQDDAVFGEWPVVLKPVTDEGQEVDDITLYNFSEFAAEAIGTGIATALDADNTYSIATKTIIETLGIKAMLVELLDLINATNEFLAFKVDEVEREIDCQVDLSESEDPIKFMQAKTLKTRGWKNADKVTLIGYLEKQMFILTILKEVFYKTGTPEVLAASVKTLLTKLQGGGQGSSAEEEGEFNSLLEKINGEYSTFLVSQGVPGVTIGPS